MDKHDRLRNLIEDTHLRAQVYRFYPIYIQLVGVNFAQSFEDVVREVAFGVHVLEQKPEALVAHSLILVSRTANGYQVLLRTAEMHPERMDDASVAREMFTPAKTGPWVVGEMESS